jgi:hypothetical protein
MEIASVQSAGLQLNQSDLDVTIIEENEHKSHRGFL